MALDGGVSLPFTGTPRRRASGPNVAAFTEFLSAAIGTRTNVFTSANSERAQQAWGARGALRLFAVRCLSGKFDRETIRLMLPAPILMSSMHGTIRMSQASLVRYTDRCSHEAETASFLARSLEPA